MTLKKRVKKLEGTPETKPVTSKRLEDLTPEQIEAGDYTFDMFDARIRHEDALRELD